MEKSNLLRKFIMLKHTEGNKFIIFNVYTSENFENEKM